MKLSFTVCLCVLMLLTEVLSQQEKSPFLRRRRLEANSGDRRMAKRRPSEDFVVSNKGKEYAESCREEPGCEWECAKMDALLNSGLESVFCVCKCHLANRIVAHRFGRAQ